MKKLLLLSVILTCLFFSSCEEMLGLAKTKTIKYEVTGTASSVSLTLNNKNDGTEQYSSVPLPWEMSFDVSIDSGSYYFAYVSAQNNGTTGTVTAKIYVDGSEFKSATSSGAYVIATASGSVNY